MKIAQMPRGGMGLHRMPTHFGRSSNELVADVYRGLPECAEPRNVHTNVSRSFLCAGMMLYRPA
jgi:hypothetical protein